MLEHQPMREPAVAGTFYPATREALVRQIDACFLHPLGPGKLPANRKEGGKPVLGLVSPHAGYVYSGPVAAHGYYALAGQPPPEVVVVIGPNHHGWGPAVALSPAAQWRTPIGRVEVDRTVTARIAAAEEQFCEDELAHIADHCIEVQLPFLQYLFGDRFRLVAIILRQQDHEVCQRLGEVLPAALAGHRALVVASTDFTHYEAQAVAVSQDKYALAPIVNLDPAGLGEAVRRHRVSMCGPGAVMAMLVACKALGAREAALLRYATSGDTGGNYAHVVAYASVAVTGADEEERVPFEQAAAARPLAGALSR